MAGALHHEIVIIGGGTAGITVAARLRRAGRDDVAVIDPSATHYYQPLWTLVGGGRADIGSTARRESDVMPKGVKWIQDAAEAVDPVAQTVTLESGTVVEYDNLVVCPGIQLDWDRIPGVSETLGRNGLSSNYRFDLAPKTWDFVRDLKEGRAVFTMPSGPIKCGGAPQKIAYLAADHWKKAGVLDGIEVVLVLPTPKMFGVPVFNSALEEIVEHYGIDVRFSSEVTEVNPETKELIVSDLEGGSKESLSYDMAHIVPPQSAPDWIKASSISTGDANGYVEIDKHTLQHVRYPNVFALGDAGRSPNSKTGAAVRKQAPVVVQNLLAHIDGRPLPASYGGYSSCPIVVGENKMLLCEFDYSGEPKPSFPVIDTTKPRKDMWLLKKYGLPFLYWNLMLKGLA